MDKNRDSRGRFIRGNIPVNMRDPKTGRFTSKLKTGNDRYIHTRIEVDRFLKSLE